MGIALGALAALIVITLLVLQVQAVQVAIGERIVTALDEEIAGSIEVASIDEVSFGRIRVHGLVFSDPRGARVLELDNVAIRIEPSALLEDRFSVSSARVDGARLVITQRGRSFGLEDAFRSAAPPGGEGGGLRVDLRAIAFRELDLVINLSGAPRARGRLSQGTVAVQTSESGVPSVRFRDVRGTLGVTSPSISFGIAEAHGTFHGAARERFVVAIDGRLGEEHFPLTVRLLARRGGSLGAMVTVDSSEGGTLADLAIIGLEAADSLSGGDFHVDDLADR